ncbi:hypothetical protein [Brytella acorum]|uniref:Uncharacterized protein n=1 Tax=Brytella acorum TaxID=2959299 RepID=A0AA35XWL8_9PROT|nr:hypothetical protein [Brytella acorum]MDF3625217.1 hypothetical protein [Brytella acorum]CAI9119371.1 hypothetical protein LMG32879_000185 [Brytella acorum]
MRDVIEGVSAFSRARIELARRAPFVTPPLLLVLGAGAAHNATIVIVPVVVALLFVVMNAAQVYGTNAGAVERTRASAAAQGSGADVPQRRPLSF